MGEPTPDAGTIRLEIDLEWQPDEFHRDISDVAPWVVATVVTALRALNRSAAPDATVHRVRHDGRTYDLVEPEVEP